ncbi:unnamed protein product [Closterium sp. Naga37s-1]|nr:unnamed protein product [Closterium sp. Naga37s-1]
MEGGMAESTVGGDWRALLEAACADDRRGGEQEAARRQLQALVRGGHVALSDVVGGMGPHLTTADGALRARGTALLAALVEAMLNARRAAATAAHNRPSLRPAPPSSPPPSGTALLAALVEAMLAVPLPPPTLATLARYFALRMVRLAPSPPPFPPLLPTTLRPLPSVAATCSARSRSSRPSLDCIRPPPHLSLPLPPILPFPHQADWPCVRGALGGALALLQRGEGVGAVAEGDAGSMAAAVVEVHVQALPQVDRMSVLGSPNLSRPPTRPPISAFEPIICLSSTPPPNHPSLPALPPSPARPPLQLALQVLRALLERHLAASPSQADKGASKRGEGGVQWAGLAVGVVAGVDGEKDPRCLLHALRIVALLVGALHGEGGSAAVSAVADDLFDVVSAYFPVSFSPPPNDPRGITREDLVQALLGAFQSTPLFAPMAVPLLLDKLSSSFATAKLDSLRFLTACATAWGPNAIGPHAPAIWRALKPLLPALHAPPPHSTSPTPSPSAPSGSGPDMSAAAAAVQCVVACVRATLPRSSSSRSSNEGRSAMGGEAAHPSLLAVMLADECVLHVGGLLAQGGKDEREGWGEARQEGTAGVAGMAGRVRAAGELLASVARVSPSASSAVSAALLPPLLRMLLPPSAHAQGEGGFDAGRMERQGGEEGGSEMCEAVQRVMLQPRGMMTLDVLRGGRGAAAGWVSRTVPPGARKQQCLEVSGLPATACVLPLLPARRTPISLPLLPARLPTLSCPCLVSSFSCPFTHLFPSATLRHFVPPSTVSPTPLQLHHLPLSLPISTPSFPLFPLFPPLVSSCSSPLSPPHPPPVAGLECLVSFPPSFSPLSPALLSQAAALLTHSLIHLPLPPAHHAAATTTTTHSSTAHTTAPQHPSKTSSNPHASLLLATPSAPTSSPALPPQPFSPALPPPTPAFARCLLRALSCLAHAEAGWGGAERGEGGEEGAEEGGRAGGEGSGGGCGEGDGSGEEEDSMSVREVVLPLLAVVGEEVMGGGSVGAEDTSGGEAEETGAERGSTEGGDAGRVMVCGEVLAAVAGEVAAARHVPGCQHEPIIALLQILSTRLIPLCDDTRPSDSSFLCNHATALFRAFTHSPSSSPTFPPSASPTPPPATDAALLAAACATLTVAAHRCSHSHQLALLSSLAPRLRLLTPSSSSSSSTPSSTHPAPAPAPLATALTMCTEEPMNRLIAALLVGLRPPLLAADATPTTPTTQTALSAAQEKEGPSQGEHTEGKEGVTGAAGVDHMALLQGLLRHLSLVATSSPALVSADSAEAASVAVASLVNKWLKEGRKVPGSSGVWSVDEVLQVVLGEVLGMEGGGEAEGGGEVRGGGWEGRVGVRRVRLLAWVGWAVAARGHASMARVAHALLQAAMGEKGAVESEERLEGDAGENGEEGEGKVGGAEGGREAAVSAVGVAAAEGFGVVMGQDAQWLTSQCHCVCRPLYQQRFLSAFLPALATSLPHMPPSSTSQSRRCAPMLARAPASLLLSALIVLCAHHCCHLHSHPTLRLFFHNISSPFPALIVLPSPRFVCFATHSPPRAQCLRAFTHTVANAPPAALLLSAPQVLPLLLSALASLSPHRIDSDCLHSLLLLLASFATSQGKARDLCGQHLTTIVTTLLALFHAHANHIAFPRCALEPCCTDPFYQLLLASPPASPRHSFHPALRLFPISFCSALHQTTPKSPPVRQEVRETAVQSLTALAALPHTQVFPHRAKVLRAMDGCLDDPKRAVRHAAVMCKTTCTPPPPQPPSTFVAVPAASPKRVTPFTFRRAQVSAASAMTEGLPPPQNAVDPTAAVAAGAAALEAELLDVLDDKGQATGEALPRGEVHRRGLWHRAVHTWVFAERGAELLLQRRAAHKESWADMWDVSSAGHVTTGCSSFLTAQREMEEELGLSLPESAFKWLFQDTFQSVLKGGTYINNEFSDVYLITVPDPLPLSAFTLQESEVAEVKWVPWRDYEASLRARDPHYVPFDVESPNGYRQLFTHLEKLSAPS